MERIGDISAETLKKIAVVLDTDIRYFLYGEDFSDVQKEEPIEPPTPLNVYELLETNERNLLITYRNLNVKEKNRPTVYLWKISISMLYARKNKQKSAKTKSSKKTLKPTQIDRRGTRL